MKKTRLLEIIREEISYALNENYSATEASCGSSIEEEPLKEMPDFGGKLDQGVASKYGEEDTLQSAVNDIVSEVLKEMGVTLEDLKKDEEIAKEALISIRDKVLGAKRKNIPQDPRVTNALEKQKDIEVDTLGGISGKVLQRNQTDNAIKKALSLTIPKTRGRKSLSPSTPTEEIPTDTEDEVGVNVNVDVDDEAPSGDVEMEKAARGRDELIMQYKNVMDTYKKKKAEEGDESAIAYLKTKQDIVKKYKKAKEVTA